MLIEKLSLISAIFGYTLSYKSIYLFHLFAITWVLKNLYIHPRKIANAVWSKKAKPLYPYFIICLYSYVSILWVPDYLVWLRYQFYLFFGSVLIIMIYLNASDEQKLRELFKYIAATLLLNYTIGFLEMLTPFRLPMSPYSDYVSLFGLPETDFSSMRTKTILHLKSLATGFNWNPNNFAFVMLIGTPFGLFYRKPWVRILAFIISAWFILNLGSRAHSIAYGSLLVFYFMFSKNSRRLIFISLTGVIILSLVLYLLDFKGPSRILDTFEDIRKGIQIMITGEYQRENSLSTRALIYVFGLKELLYSWGFGLGFGGIESRLIQESFSLKNLHFFFLQLLIDFGVIMFTFIMFFYFKLAFALRSIHEHSKSSYLSYMSGACSLSLLVALPASLAPSAVHYILPFYILIGLGLAVIKVHRTETR